MCNMDKKKLLSNLLQSNLLPLAFIGDSIHTLFVREQVLQNASGKMENYHTQASRYCKASHQAKILEKIKPNLSEDESEIVRRARNAKPKHQAKNATSQEYIEATSFEALVGYLYLKEDTERLNEILQLSIED